MELKEKLVALRKEKGLTQLVVAEKLNVSRQAISRWESGTAQPSTDNLRCLGALYEVPIDYLVNEETERPISEDDSRQDENKQKHSQVVENRQHIIKHCRGKMFTSESLKIVALICMLIDHAGATLFPQCDILRSIGRVSFPLYAFLLAQGCKHTHSMERYLLGLGIFALISEIPYDLAFGNSINFLEQTNIFYTLFLSAACVYIYDSIKKQKTMIQLIVFAVCLLFLFMEWILLTFITGERLPSVALMFSYVMGMIISCAHIFKHHEIANSKSNILINIFPILSTLPAFLLSSFIDCDYGIWGVALISLLYLAKSIKISAVIMAVLLVPYYGQHIYSNVVSFEAIRNMCFSLLSILFVCLYNGQHGSKKKWIYYWAYPLHILFFAILRC